MRTPLFRRATALLLAAALAGSVSAAFAGAAFDPVPVAAAPAAPTVDSPGDGDAPDDALQAVVDTITRFGRYATGTATCADAGSGSVPELVADIFRCRLREAGWHEPEVARVAAEAVVVAHCESLWDPAAVVFDGRYVDSPHPRTGARHSAAGVFQFIRRVADLWIDGGYAAVTDARRNIDAAARIYLHNRARGYNGWADWACVAANDGFQSASVLPGWPGGPATLPDWALEY